MFHIYASLAATVCPRGFLLQRCGGKFQGYYHVAGTESTLICSFNREFNAQSQTHNSRHMFENRHMCCSFNPVAYMKFRVDHGLVGKCLHLAVAGLVLLMLWRTALCRYHGMLRCREVEYTHSLPYPYIGTFNSQPSGDSSECRWGNPGAESTECETVLNRKSLLNG